MFRPKPILAVVLVVTVLGGCAGLAVEGANKAADRLRYSKHIDAARNGDPVAQFKVGDALCCSAGEAAGPFYSTAKSIAWLCAAAKQDNAQAMFRLGQIYAGDIVDGARIIRRVANGVAGVPTNPPVAYYWFREAEKRGAKEAAAFADSLLDDFDPEQRAAADSYTDSTEAVSCSWDELVNGPTARS